MAEITNRQVLINLHSATKELTDVNLVEFGEIAIKHDTPTGATIYTKTADGVAKFVTDLAVDAKVAVVAGALEDHIEAYNQKVAQLEAADTANQNAIAAVEKRVETLEQKESDIEDQLEEINGRVTANTAAIAQEVQDRKDADSAITAAYEAADAAIRGDLDTLEANLSAETKAREDADAKIEKDYKEADATLKSGYEAADAKLQGEIDAVELAVSGLTTRMDAAEANITQLQSDVDQVESDLADEIQNRKDADSTIEAAYKAADSAIETAYKAADSTIEAAYKAADSAITEAYEKADGELKTYIDNVSAATVSAQTTATSALTKIEAFMLAAEVGDKAVDTLLEIQNYISEDAELADTIVKNISAVSAATITNAEKIAEVSAATVTNKGNIEQNATDIQTVSAATIAAQEDATSALNKIAAASGTTTSTGGVHVTVETTESEGKVTGITVTENDIASASATTEAINDAKRRLDELESQIIEEAQITGLNADHAGVLDGVIANNKLTFDFSNLVIDCGTF